MDLNLAQPTEQVTSRSTGRLPLRASDPPPGVATVSRLRIHEWAAAKRAPDADYGRAVVSLSVNRSAVHSEELPLPFKALEFVNAAIGEA